MYDFYKPELTKNKVEPIKFLLPRLRNNFQTETLLPINYTNVQRSQAVTAGVSIIAIKTIILVVKKP